MCLLAKVLSQNIINVFIRESFLFPNPRKFIQNISRVFQLTIPDHCFFLKIQIFGFDLIL